MVLHRVVRAEARHCGTLIGMMFPYHVDRREDEPNRTTQHVLRGVSPFLTRERLFAHPDSERPSIQLTGYISPCSEVFLASMT